MGLYNGFGISVAGIIPYRGVYFGMFDTMNDYNNYKNSDNAIARIGSVFLVAQSTAITAG
jgi:solute carrier family 25 (adenine nucleotide translocator) protein 4/5/6/31